MATKKNQGIEDQDPEVVIETAINSTEEFIYKNGKSLLAALCAIILIAGGYFGYKYLYQAPREAAAADMMFVAEQLFGADNFQLAVAGDESVAGFEAVIAEYGSTNAGNLAKHYAGICYLKMDENDKALEALKGYKPSKGVPNQLIAAQNYGLQGDLLSQKQDYAASAELYTKAVAASSNVLTAPIYLNKLILVYIALGDNVKALETANRILDEYSSSMEARDVQKMIGQLEQKIK